MVVWGCFRIFGTGNITNCTYHHGDNSRVDGNGNRPTISLWLLNSIRRTCRNGFCVAIYIQPFVNDTEINLMLIYVIISKSQIGIASYID